MRKDWNKKILLALMAITIASVGVTGCNKAEGSTASNGEGGKAEKVEFKFITAMSDSDRTAIIDSVVDQLKEKYPNVTFVNESGDDYNNKAKLAFSSDSGYDLVFTDDLGLTALREAGYLLELSDYIEERDWVNKQYEGVTDFYNQRTPGEQYTVGMNYAPVVVYYNKAIFDELNLEIPRTLEEYENVLKVATEAGYIGAENSKDNVNGWYIQSMVQNKAPFEDILKWYYLEESKDSVQAAFIDAAETVKKWSDAGYFRKHYEGIDYGDVPSLFGQGQTAMSLDGNWFLYDYENTGLDVGVFAFPGVDDPAAENYIINPVDAAFGIGNHVNETELAVALDFIDLMLTPETSEQWLKVGSLPSLAFEFEEGAASPLTMELLDVVEDTRSGFYLDNVRPGFLDMYTKEVQLYIAGEKSVEEMWDRLNEFWNEG